MASIVDTEKQNKIALISCLEIILMRKGNTSYNWIVTKLSSQYDCEIRDCYEHPEYLRAVLKQVYGNDFNEITTNLKLELDELTKVKEIANFLKVLES